MKVAIYGRVSTAEQIAAMQLGEMRDFCGRREWEIVEEFTDTMTGSNESRPALNRLLAAAKPGSSMLCWCIAMTALRAVSGNS